MLSQYQQTLTDIPLVSTLEKYFLTNSADGWKTKFAKSTLQGMAKFFIAIPKDEQLKSRINALFSEFGNAIPTVLNMVDKRLASDESEQTHQNQQESISSDESQNSISHESDDDTIETNSQQKADDPLQSAIDRLNHQVANYQCQINQSNRDVLSRMKNTDNDPIKKTLSNIRVNFIAIIQAASYGKKQKQAITNDRLNCIKQELSRVCGGHIDQQMHAVQNDYDNLMRSRYAAHDGLVRAVVQALSLQKPHQSFANDSIDNLQQKAEQMLQSMRQERENQLLNELLEKHERERCELYQYYVQPAIDGFYKALHDYSNERDIGMAYQQCARDIQQFDEDNDAAEAISDINQRLRSAKIRHDVQDNAQLILEGVKQRQKITNESKSVSQSHSEPNQPNGSFSSERQDEAAPANNMNTKLGNALAAIKRFFDEIGRFMTAVFNGIRCAITHSDAHVTSKLSGSNNETLDQYAGLFGRAKFGFFRGNELDAVSFSWSQPFLGV